MKRGGGETGGTDGKKKEAGEELKWATQSTFSLLDAFDRGKTRPTGATDRLSKSSVGNDSGIVEKVKINCCVPREVKF